MLVSAFACLSLVNNVLYIIMGVFLSSMGNFYISTRALVPPAIYIGVNLAC